MASLISKIVGHRSVWDRLLRAQSSGHLHHSLIFSGPNSVGKKRIALAFAQSLLCDKNEVGACGSCGSCLRVEREQHEGLLIFHDETAPIKMDQSREILQFLSLRGISKARVILIDEAQDMSPQAGNALLKIVEEPPENTYFIFICSSQASLLSTLRSRSQAFSFSPLSTTELQQILEVPLWVAEASGGSLSRAEQLSQPESSEFRLQSLKPLEDLAFGRSSEALDALRSMASSKDQALWALRYWQQILRDARLSQAGADQDLIHRDQIQLVHKLAELSEKDLHSLFDLSFQLERDLLSNVDRNLVFEYSFNRMSEVF